MFRKPADAAAPPLRRLYSSLRDQIILRQSAQAKYRFGPVKRLLRPLLGKVGTQPVFGAMYRLALAGMGFGDAGVVLYSGESWAFEHVMKTLARRYAPNERVVVFDVGANSGEYSLMACPRLLQTFPFGQIHAFEPSGSTFKHLTSNVGGLDSVQPHRLAFGEKPGVSTLYQVSEGSGYASLYDRESGSLAQYGLKTALTEEVQVSTIDEFCLENSIDRIHLLKIDVEGHEFKVLTGAQSMLESDAIDAIQFEFSAGCLDSRIFFKDFFDLLGGRFKVSRILRNGLYPLPKYSERLEIFATSNYLAECVPNENWRRFRTQT